MIIIHLYPFIDLSYLPVYEKMGNEEKAFETYVGIRDAKICPVNMLGFMAGVHFALGKIYLRRDEVHTAVDSFHAMMALSHEANRMHYSNWNPLWTGEPEGLGDMMIQSMRLMAKVLPEMPPKIKEIRDQVVSENRLEAERFKKVGNDHFKKKEYRLAVHSYNQGM